MIIKTKDFKILRFSFSLESTPCDMDFFGQISLHLHTLQW